MSSGAAARIQLVVSAYFVAAMMTVAAARPAAAASLQARGVVEVGSDVAASSDSVEVGSDSVDVKSAAMQTRVYVGMWSTHLRDIGRGLGANSLIGFAFRGFFGGTFINSFGDRSVALGMQRSFTSPRSGAMTTALGYRLGVITGYDERFFGIGDKLPALPFAQLVARLDIRNVGIEATYSGIVASIMLSCRL